MNRWLAVAVLAVIPAVASAQQHPTRAYKREVPPRLLRQTKITEDSALKVAQARIPSGTVQALELENENGHLIWSFEFKVPHRPGIYEANVDAKDGSLVGRVEHEVPGAERRDSSHAASKPRP
jgi:uncharacterized membrane protein YkoI